MQEDAKLAGTRGRPRCKAWKSTEVKLKERGQTLVGAGTKEMERPRAENSAVSDELAKDDRQRAHEQMCDRRGETGPQETKRRRKR